MSQNIATLPVYLVPFRQSLFVVATNVLLQTMLLPKLAYWLARIKVRDEQREMITFNMARINTLYVVSFSSQILAPVLYTFLLDENCLR